MCFALTSYLVNLKMGAVTNGKGSRMLSRVNGQREGTVSFAMLYYWETKLAGVSPLVLWVLEGGISHSFRRWGMLCSLIALSFGLVKDALICCKRIRSSPSLEGRKENGCYALS